MSNTTESKKHGSKLKLTFLGFPRNMLQEGNFFGKHLLYTTQRRNLIDCFSLTDYQPGRTARLHHRR